MLSIAAPAPPLAFTPLPVLLVMTLSVMSAVTGPFVASSLIPPPQG
jgi:hypothetical protein